jgi:hypothetical protein
VRAQLDKQADKANGDVNMAKGEITQLMLVIKRLEVGSDG